MIFDKLIDKIVAKKIKEYREKATKYLEENKEKIAQGILDTLSKYFNDLLCLLKVKIVNKLNNLYEKIRGK